MISIAIENGPQETRVAISGEMNVVATTEQASELNQIIALADKALEVDCSGLEYISSAGLRFFMQLKHESMAKGGSVRITHLNEDVADIFRMSGFENIFEVD